MLEGAGAAVAAGTRDKGRMHTTPAMPAPTKSGEYPPATPTRAGPRMDPTPYDAFTRASIAGLRRPNRVAKCRLMRTTRPPAPKPSRNSVTRRIGHEGDAAAASAPALNTIALKTRRRWTAQRTGARPKIAIPANEPKKCAATINPPALELTPNRATT